MRVASTADGPATRAGTDRWLVDNAPSVDVGVLPATEPGTRVYRAPNGVILLDEPVLDGTPARELGPSEQGDWYACQLGRSLTDRLRCDPGMDLREALAAEMARLAIAYPLPPAAVPARAAGCAMAIARWHAGRVDVLVLGPGPAVIAQHTDGPVTVIHDAGDATAANAGPGLVHRPGSPAGTRTAASGQAHAACAVSWPVRDIAVLAVLTGGLLPAVTASYTTWPMFMNAALTSGAQAILDDLRVTGLPAAAGRLSPRRVVTGGEALAIARLTRRSPAGGHVASAASTGLSDTSTAGSPWSPTRSSPPPQTHVLNETHHGNRPADQHS